MAEVFFRPEDTSEKAAAKERPNSALLTYMRDKVFPHVNQPKFANMSPQSKQQWVATKFDTKAKELGVYEDTKEFVDFRNNIMTAGDTSAVLNPAVQSAFQGATFSASDEILGKARSFLPEAIGGVDEEAALAAERAQQAAFKRDNPVASFVTQLAGGAVVPGGLTAKYLPRLLKTTGQTRTAALLRGGLAGGTTGAAGGAVEGFMSGEGGFQNRLDRVVPGAIAGAFMGAPFGATGAAISHRINPTEAYSAGRQRILKALDPTDDAANQMTPAEAMERAAEMQDISGAPAMLADVSPHLRSEADTAISMVPQARDVYTQRARARDRSAAQRLSEGAQTEMGIDEPLFPYRQTLRETTKAAADVEYADAMTGTVPRSPGRDAILQNRHVQNAMKDAADYHPAPQTSPLLQSGGRNINRTVPVRDIHAIQQAMSDAADAADRQGKARLAGSIRRSRDRLMNHTYNNAVSISGTAGDSYRRGTALIREEHDIDRAIDVGRKVFRTEPDELADTVSNMTPAQTEAARTAVFEELNKKILKAKDTHAPGRRIMQSPYERSQLRPFFESDDAMEATLNRLAIEEEYRRSLDQITGGSQTQTRQERARALEEDVAGIPIEDQLGFDVTSAEANPIGVVNSILRRLYRIRAGGARDQRVRTASAEIARIMSVPLSTPERRRAVQEVLERTGFRLRMGDQIDEILRRFPLAAGIAADQDAMADELDAYINANEALQQQ